MSEFLCFLCGKSFHDKSSLRQHKHGVHSTAELPCNQCNKILIGTKKLHAHMDSHKKYVVQFVKKLFQKNRGQLTNATILKDFYVSSVLLSHHGKSH